MLVLSRKVGERIHVGENITIEIRRITGNRVTIALEAPRDVRILRGELERAAREFDVADGERNELTQIMPLSNGSMARMSLEGSLPASPMGRDFSI